MTEREIFMAAVQIKSAAEREAYLQEACGADPAVRERVQRLLRVYKNAGSFLELPAAAPTMTVTADEQPLTEGPGTVIGPYKLLEQIGEGGMGAVYMAEQARPVRRKVALKIIKPGMDSRQVIARFEAERQALALMDHPNIARVLEAGTTDPPQAGRPYFVMELVRGIPITEYCDRNRLVIADRLELFVLVCQAVQHAHQKGIIHRDLKPSNVLVTRVDGAAVPKVIDFGIAKAMGQQLTEKTLFTGFAQLIGTPLYMSPEQAELSGVDIDTRSDIYSLGVLLYELLTGTTPFDAETFRTAGYDEMRRIIREEEPPRPSTRISTQGEAETTISANRQTDPHRLRKSLRGELDWIVMKCLDKDRNRRYETASALVADVRHYLHDEPVQACPPSAWYRLRKYARRYRAVLATATVVAGALVAVAVISVFSAIEQARTNKEIRGLASALGRERQSLTASLAESNRLLAIRNFDRGQAAFEKDQIGPGLLWMIESWRSAIAAGDTAWQHAARANLAAWRPHHLRLKAVLSHQGPVESAAFSPDGKTIFTGSDDYTAQLWDAATAQPIGPPIRHEGVVLSVAFGPDGNTLLTGCADKTARLWDIATGRPIGLPLLHPHIVNVVAFSPDGKVILTGCRDHIARLWDVATGLPTGPAAKHESAVVAVAISPDGTTLFSASFTGGAQLCSTDSGKFIASALTAAAGIYSVAFSPDSKFAFTGSADGTVQCWDAATAKPVGDPRRYHRLKVVAVAISPDGTRLLTGSEDKTARLWDAVTSAPIGAPLVHQGTVRAVAFSPDGRSFLTASSDNTVRLWDADAGQPFGLVLDHQDGGQVVTFSRDGRSVFSGDNFATVKRWSAATGETIGQAMHLEDGPNAVAVSHDGTQLLTGGSDKTARLWDATTGQPVGPALRHDDDVSVVAFCADGKTIMTGCADAIVRFWDAVTGTPLGQPIPQPESVDAGAFSPDGKRFVVGCASGSAQVWDLATRTPVGRPFPHPGCISAAAFSPDGKTLLTGCEDGGARLWDVETSKLRLPPLLNQAWIYCATFNHDGTIVLTGCKDRTARLWDTATGMPLGPPIPHPKRVLTVAFSPDGNEFVMGIVGWGARLFRKAPELPDDVDRVSAWVEVLTGCTLDPGEGTIQVLDNAAWRERRAHLEQRGGAPETGRGRRLDPFLLGTDPIARGRILIERGLWAEAEAAFDKIVQARPYNASSWSARGELHAARGQHEKAAADFAAALEREPEDPQNHYRVAIANLVAGELTGYRAACAGMLERFQGYVQPRFANRVAYTCVYGPDAVVDMPSLIRVAERAVPSHPGGERMVAAVLYRAGRYAGALKQFDQAHKAFKPRAWDWLFLAMIHGRLQHPDEARRMLALANQWIKDTEAAKSWDGEIEKPTILLLRREAEAVVLLDPAFPADTFAH
jgi:WD40 repeat protein/serine/threonine protein kinase/tetratricopeptide (TPR) repeat protein